MQRVAAERRVQDEAVMDFLRLGRWMWSIFFQSWARRQASELTPSTAFVKHPSLLRNPVFAAFFVTLAASF